MTVYRSLFLRRAAPLGGLFCALFLFLAVSATPAQAQVYHLTNSGTINFPLRGRDVVVDAYSPNFPITATIGPGAEISSNGDATDGYQGMEAFYNNNVAVTGGVFFAEDNRPGGVTMHDTSGFAITEGAMNYVRLQDQSNGAISGGVIQQVEASDQSNILFYSGQISSVLAAGSSRISLRGGVIGSAGLFRLEKSRLDVYGAGLRLYSPRRTTFRGLSGLSYLLTGVLSDGSPIKTRLFNADGFINAPVENIRFNGQSVTVTAAPESPSGVLLLAGLAALIFCHRLRTEAQK